MGLSRNKVAVPEGAAGTPPFWSGGSCSCDVTQEQKGIKKPSAIRGSSQAPLRLPVLRTLFYGGLAQLARALAWHARGHRFDPDILHTPLERARDL